MTELEAIKIAKKYGLEKEIQELIDYEGLSPEQALREWDIY